MTLSIYVENRQNGWRNTLRALRVPFPLQWGRFLRGGDGEQIWKSVLKRTQNYCVDLLALYLRQMLIKIHYSNKVVNLRGSCRNNALPRPHRKSFSSLQYSVPACEKSFFLIQERNMLFVDLTVKYSLG